MALRLKLPPALLTKRSRRLAALAPEIDWPGNVWVGVSVERADVLYRVDDLRELSGPAVRFLSLEPLLGALDDLKLAGIDWVIVGGESGPSARPMKAEWVRPIRDLCVKEGVPFFFKQWGGHNRKQTGRVLDDHLWHQMPTNEGPEPGEIGRRAGQMALPVTAAR